MTVVSVYDEVLNGAVVRERHEFAPSLIVRDIYAEVREDRVFMDPAERVFSDVLFITPPRESALYAAGAHARAIVRAGMQDVLEWVGER